MPDDLLHVLFEDMHRRLYRYVATRTSHVNAEEVVSETFLSALRQRDTLPPTLPEQRAWLQSVARRRLVDLQRRETRRAGAERTVRAALVAGVPVVEADPALTVAEVDAARQLRRRLSPSDQELFQLSAWDGLSTKEIAVVLEITETAAAMRLARLRRKVEAWSRLSDLLPEDVRGRTDPTGKGS